MPYQKTNLQIDRDTRLQLDNYEYWHFLSIQIRWVTIVTFMISWIELLTFIICFYSMDAEKVFQINVPSVFDGFKFYCEENSVSRWNTDVKPQAEILFTMHVIIIFMYSTINLMVLSTVPFKYNRFMKTDDEKKIEKAKKKAKKKKQRG